MARKRKTKAKQASEPKTPIEIFFNGFQSFDYDSSAPVRQEFSRMCDQFGWERQGKRRKRIEQNFKTAMVEQFNFLYGTNEKDLAAWQNLCLVLNIAPLDSKTACRKAVSRTHVNIVDMIDNYYTGEQVRVFANLGALRKYTQDTGKYFPKEHAKAGGLLRHLLRRIR